MSRFAGFLQTPGWTESLGRPEVWINYSVVYFLRRPTGQAVMMSMVQMDIEMDEYFVACEIARLSIYMKNTKNSLYILWRDICNSDSLDPVVLTANIAMTFFERTTKVWPSTFRLLFTYHEVLKLSTSCLLHSTANCEKA